jgi:hypothetical protein
MTLDLLLVHDDDNSPVLPRGLSSEALKKAPRLAPDPNPPEHLWDPGGDPNALPQQRWALLAPKGPAGDRLLQHVEALRQKRREDQGGAPVREYRVAPGMSGIESSRWMRDEFLRSASRERELPRYLLILGDFDQVSLELQQVLAERAFVGRLAFRREEDYSAYVEKVLRWEREPAGEQAGRVLFFTAGTPDGAMQTGRQKLVTPTWEACREAAEMGDFTARALTRLEGAPDHLLAETATPGPDVLFTLSHGVGPPKKGWDSLQHQQAHQGELMLDGKERLTAGELAGRHFLPGGLWFCFACFGAGTPSRSVYLPWLQGLQQQGLPIQPPAFMSLEGQSPFVAALPQAALANPRGPLAFMGHVDLAWSFSFQDMSGHSHAARFTSLVIELMRGRRAGVAHHVLMKSAGGVNTALRILEQEEVLGLSAPHGLERGLLWLTWQDLRAFVLLGDPAVRLPLAPPGPGPHP